MAEDFSLSWNLETLNKAYKQGYMCGVMGSDPSKRPMMTEVVLAAWEAGWEDGKEVVFEEAAASSRMAS